MFDLPFVAKVHWLKREEGLTAGMWQLFNKSQWAILNKNSNGCHLVFQNEPKSNIIQRIYLTKYPTQFGEDLHRSFFSCAENKEVANGHTDR